MQNSTQWLWTVVVERKEDNGLLATVKQQKEYHYGKIKQFFLQIIETYDMATEVEVRSH